MKGRFLLLTLSVLAVAGVLAATGCGGGGGSAEDLAAGDIAVVGTQHITKESFDQLMSEAEANYKLQGRTFPKAGTSEYSQIKSQAMTILVQQAETEAEAAKLGLKVTDKDVEEQLTAIKARCCEGKEAKYRAALKQQGLTDDEVRQNARSSAFAKKVADEITKGIKIAPTAITAYYVQHQSEFQTPSARDVRYILVGKNKASLANSLFQQLSGADDKTWCTLAKKYSQDPSSSGKCGKASFPKGQTVPEFDKLLFSLPTNKLGKVNTPQYGWFVLQPTSKPTEAKTTPVGKAGKQIEQTLLETKKQAAINDWSTKTQKEYCNGGKIAYQAGYKPNPDPCAANTATTTTTG
jgi:parvulin-like peptidyl-prolyl isomerase